MNGEGIARYQRCGGPGASIRRKNKTTTTDRMFFLQGRPMGLPQHTAASLAADRMLENRKHVQALTTYNLR